MQLRCPCLGIQVFVRGLCDLHVIAPHPYLGAQFSTAFDVYLSLWAAAHEGCTRARHPQLAIEERLPRLPLRTRRGAEAQEAHHCHAGRQ
jgi:hypothetical protein